MDQNLNLFVLEDHSDGVLNLNDLHFFYYDIGMDTLNGIPCLYVDNNEVVSLKNNRHLVIKALEQSLLPKTFQDGHIYFGGRRDVLCVFKVSRERKVTASG